MPKLSLVASVVSGLARDDVFDANETGDELAASNADWLCWMFDVVRVDELLTGARVTEAEVRVRLSRSIVAAPGPLPKAGTEPICFEVLVAVLDVGEKTGEVVRLEEVAENFEVDSAGW